MTRQVALSCLGLDQGASESDVRQAYRDLAKVWHPDRFEHDRRLRAKAEEEFKRISLAYKIAMRRDWAVPSTGPRGTDAVPASPAPSVEDARGSPLPRAFVLFYWTWVAILFLGLWGYARLLDHVPGLIGFLVFLLGLAVWVVVLLFAVVGKRKGG
jgi:hypothetical protein